MRTPGAIGLALLLAFSVTAPACAQSLWNRFVRPPAAAAPPCPLDNCAEAKTTAQAESAYRAPTRSAPGDFDFYLLTLSWSPGFCDSGGAQKSPSQCAIGSGLGFVVHGLWPQYQHGYPSDCDVNARPVSSAALAQTRGVFPNEGLARYEYRKHGSCSGLDPQAFFAAARQAREAIVIPDLFKNPREQQTLAPAEIMRAFLAVNDNMHWNNMAVGCSHGELEDVRICLAKDLTAFAECSEVARQTCRAPAIHAAPIH